MPQVMIPVRVGDADVIVSALTTPGEAQVAGGTTGQFVFDTVVDGLEAVSHALAKCLLAVAPTETKVELNVGFQAKAGKLLAVFMDSSASGALKVTLTWSHKTDDEDDKKKGGKEEKKEDEGEQADEAAKIEDGAGKESNE